MVAIKLPELVVAQDKDDNVRLHHLLFVFNHAQVAARSPYAIGLTFQCTGKAKPELHNLDSENHEEDVPCDLCGRTDQRLPEGQAA